MKYYTKRIDSTDCHIFEFLPSNDTILACTGDSSLQKLSNIKHDWHEQTKKQVAGINASYFWGNNPVGGVYVDSGFLRSSFSADKKWSTLIYENGKLIIDDLNNFNQLKAKYPKASFMLQLGGRLIIDGKINLNPNLFDHSNYRNPRTTIGQKKDGTIMFFATDGRTDRGFTMAELAKVMLDFGCFTAINCDGGGSSTITINGKMVNTNENRKVINGLFCYTNKDIKEIEKKSNEVLSNPSKKKLILISDGHGTNTLGKITPVMPDGLRIKENEFNRRVVDLIEEMALKSGLFEVVKVAPELTDTPLETRTNRANVAYDNWIKQGNKKSDVLYISVHFNALNGIFDGKAGGVETLVYELRGDTVRLGDAIHSEVLKGVKQINRGVKARPDLWELRKTKMLACLIEYGFMDKIEEAELMLNKDFQEECARETLTGICNYFGLKFENVIVNDYKAIIKKSSESLESAETWIKRIDNLIANEKDFKYLPLLIEKIYNSSKN